MGLTDQNKSWKSANRRTILTVFGVTTFIIGLTVSAVIYLGADDSEPDVLGYEIIGGTAYPIQPEDSKTYQRDLEMAGGKMYVLIDEFQRWFSGLWHGKTLAVIIAVAAGLTSAGLLYFARNWPPEDRGDGSGQKDADSRS